MKKTLTVNLSGIIFHIDEDAYNLLNEYLTNLRVHFQKEQGSEEIILDIEQRISELFSEKIETNVQVISIDYVEDVIKRMGKPEELEEESQSNTSFNAAQEVKDSTTIIGARKFYRNPDDKMLGGVLGGLAIYLNIDPTLLRLIAVVLLPFTLIPFAVYVGLWMCIPLAKTAAERLSMRGLSPTIENIGKDVTEGYERVKNGENNYMKSDLPRTKLQKIGDVLVRVIGVILKLLLGILIICMFPIVLILLFALAVAVISVCVVIFAVLFTGGGLATLLANQTLSNYLCFSMPFSFTNLPIIDICIVLLSIIVIAIPVLSFSYSLYHRIFKWAPLTKLTKRILFVLWLLCFIATIILFLA